MPAPFHYNASLNGPAEDLAYLQATHGYAGRGNFYQSWIFDGEFPVGHPRAAAVAQIPTQSQAQLPAPTNQAVQVLNNAQQQIAAQSIGNAQAAVPSVGNGAMNVNANVPATKKFRAFKRLDCIAPPGDFIVKSLAGTRRKLVDAFTKEETINSVVSQRKKEDHPLWILQSRTPKERKKRSSTFSYRLLPTIANDDRRHLPYLPNHRIQRKKEKKAKDRPWHGVLTWASEMIAVQAPLISPLVGIQEFIPTHSCIGPIRQVTSDNRYLPYSRNKRTSRRKVPVWPFDLNRKIKAIKSIYNCSAESVEAASGTPECPVPATAISTATHIVQCAKTIGTLSIVPNVPPPQASFTPTAKVVADSAPLSSRAPCRSHRKKRSADSPSDPKTIWMASRRKKALRQSPGAYIDGGGMDLTEDMYRVPDDSSADQRKPTKL